MRSASLLGLATVLALIGGGGLALSGAATSAEAVTYSTVATTGTLTLTTPYAQPGGSLTFDYVTDRPGAKNWIGVYNSEATSPYDQASHGSSPTWKYVTDSSGTVTIPTTGLTTGHTLVAYLMYNDGYTWLAQPVLFRIGLTKPAGTMTLANPTAAVGDTLHFTWATTTPNAKNWIALYNAPAGAPFDGTSHGKSTDFEYVTSATATSGTLDVSSSALTAGHDVVAYFLYADGYQSLAPPITFRLTAPVQTPLGTGTLAMINTAPHQGDTLQFTYTTDHPNAMNFIGLYDTPSNGPFDQKYHAASTVWGRAPDASGTISLSSDALTAGHDIAAYFLYNDGYQWLSTPITFRLTEAPVVGTLTMLNTAPKQGDALQFSYTTNKPNGLNWVGLYDPASGGPYDQKVHNPSTVWKYVSGSSGTVTLSSGLLSDSKDIAAYFLYNDGYSWLAQPITFQLAPPAPTIPGPQGPHFTPSAMTSAAVPASTTRTIDVAGLWFGSGALPVTFAKSGGDDWLTVAADGTITATAPASPPQHPGIISVTATDSAGATGTITVAVPVSKKGSAPTVKTATLNLWDAGSHVADPDEKLVASILLNGLDVVGVQESGGVEATKVASLLGWYSDESASGLGIVSRYPLTERPTPSVGGEVAVPPAITAAVDVNGSPVNVWVTALDESDPGPDRACFSGATDLASHEKTTVRYAQAAALADSMTADLKGRNKVPLIVLGSLASPSHLDWTAATSAAHCNAGAVDWPVTQLLQDAGLTDAFRAAEPDPTSEPGITSSPVRPTRTGTSDPEPQDRLDYVEFAGDLRTVESHALVDGFPAVLPDVSANSWVSDRAAAVATFVLPVAAGEPVTTNPPVPPRQPDVAGDASETSGSTSPQPSSASPTASPVTPRPTPSSSAPATPDYGAGEGPEPGPLVDSPVTPVLVSPVFQIVMWVAIAAAVLIALALLYLIYRARQGRVSANQKDRP